VGHLARLIEAAGIATVAIYVRAFAHVAQAIRVPRAVVTRHPVGRTVGAPHDVERQREVLLSALSLLETATSPTVVELPMAYRIVSWR